MLVTWLVLAGVVLLPLPALVAGARGLLRRPGYIAGEPAERASRVLLVAGRALLLLLVLALSALVLVSTVGALLQDVELHPAVFVFFVLDLLLATAIVLTFGRLEPRPARRRASPGGR